MIKVKDGYAKLIGTTYQGSATQVLLSNGGDLEYSASSKASTLVQRNASQHIYATYFNSAISDEALTDIGSVYVRNTSDTFIRRVSKTQFYSILDDKFVTLDTTQSITGAKTFSTSVRFANNASIIQNQNDTSNYTTILKWYKNGASRNTYDPSIGQHNTGGDGKGSICILPYPTETSPQGGTVGLFISKGVLKLDGKSVALAENYYNKTESDKRYVNVTGDTMTGPLTVKATVTGTQLISTIAAGTSPLKVTSTTVVTNLNSDLLDGFHAASFYQYGYVMFARTIDASALSTSTYYPVTFSIGSHSNVRIECRVSLNSGTKPSWSKHTSGFSVRKIWEVNGSGWGTNFINRRILVSDYAHADSDPVRGVGQLSNSSTEYVYVRGGGKYLFYISHNISATLHTSTYTANSQSVAPTTSAPADIPTPTLTFSAGKFSKLSYKPLIGINTVNIPTNTSHLTNDSGFWTGTRYWANVAVSTASSTSTQPTFNTCYTSDWFRSTGRTGWYSQTYGGGWYMTDSIWIRTYGSKSVYQNTGQIRTDGYLVTNGGITVGATSPNNGTYKSHVTGNSWSSGYIRAGAGFYHNSVNSNNYVLLAGGSYKSLADFVKGNAGSATKGVYVTGGTVTAMTYSLSSNVNSGTAGKLAYYSSANTLSNYTTTVGSAHQPVYMNAGVPTICSYYSFLGTSYQPVVLVSGYFYRNSSTSNSWYYTGYKHSQIGYPTFYVNGGVMRLTFSNSKQCSFISAAAQGRQNFAGNNTVNVQAYDGSNGNYGWRSEGSYWFNSVVTNSSYTSYLYIRAYRQANGNNDSWYTGDNCWKQEEDAIQSVSFTIFGYIYP